MALVPPPDDGQLATVRRHRAELRGAVGGLEGALAAPSPGRDKEWAEAVLAALGVLAADFRDHVRITEGPQGLYARVLRSAPRLAGGVRRLTEQHADLATRIDQLGGVLGKDGQPLDVESVREQGTRLLGELVRHRQRGSDLVYEAYAVDIGGDG